MLGHLRQHPRLGALLLPRRLRPRAGRKDLPRSVGHQEVMFSAARSGRSNLRKRFTLSLSRSSEMSIPKTSCILRTSILSILFMHECMVFHLLIKGTEMSAPKTSCILRTSIFGILFMQDFHVFFFLSREYSLTFLLTDTAFVRN